MRYHLYHHLYPTTCSSAGLSCFLLFLQLVAGSLATPDHTAARDLIVGGTNVTNGEYSFFTFSKFGRNNGCGGTLIHSDVILTAAHCATAYEGRGARVGARNDFGTEGGEFHEDERLKSHPDFDPDTFDNDVMVVVLQTSTSIEPVAMSRTDDLAVGTPLTVLGFGHTSSGGTLSPTLLQTEIQVVEFGPCQKLFLNESEVEIDSSLQVCAYDTTGGGRDACQADSGGPILNAAGEQVGITSFGLGCSQQDTPGVYVRLSAYVSWIEEQVCLLSKDPPSNCPVPSNNPTLPPSTRPSYARSVEPSSSPTREPSSNPSVPDTETPTSSPSSSPSVEKPTLAPSSSPSVEQPSNGAQIMGRSISLMLSLGMSTLLL